MALAPRGPPARPRVPAAPGPGGSTGQAGRAREARLLRGACLALMSCCGSRQTRRVSLQACAPLWRGAVGGAARLATGPVTRGLDSIAPVSHGRGGLGAWHDSRPESLACACPTGLALAGIRLAPEAAPIELYRSSRAIRVPCPTGHTLYQPTFVAAVPSGPAEPGIDPQATLVKRRHVTVRKHFTSSAV